MNRSSKFANLLGALLVAACAGTHASPPQGTGGTGGSAGTGGGPAAAPTFVMTDKGPVQGTVSGSSRLFFAIPFAAPPVGDLRWKPPAPHAPWTMPVAATAPGPACGQLDALTAMSFDTSSSEDCLTLNVWAPKAASTTKAPVMLWIYGGSFVIGSGGMSDYDGQKLSEATGAIVVTINYRLGPLGFLALPALHAEDPTHPSSGMYGFEDQRAAIAWTKSNIAAFGGDPTNITIFGESAGGISVCTHLVSPPSKGLFARAIIESGAYAIGLTATETAADAQGAALVKALGCDGKSDPDTLACMRAVKFDQVLLAMPASPFNIVTGGTSWGTVIDGLNLPDDPVKLFGKNAFAMVPTLLGTNTNEGSLFFAFSNPVTSDATYQTFADALFPG
jgi:para-nitrobenzyl esterase